MRFILTILISTHCLFAITLRAQSVRQAERWHFGNGISLRFVDGAPVLDPPSAMRTLEGACSLSDSLGNLLFYSNGGGRPPGNGGPLGQDQDAGTIWNRNHEVMYDMRGVEGGGFSARQSALPIPAPGNNPGLYYLFTMEEAEFAVGGTTPGQPLGRGLSYFLIDMRRNGGLGEVTLADQRVQVPAYEGLAATPMVGTEGYWIACHNNTEGPQGQLFLVPLTEQGVGVPVGIPVAGGAGGRIKFSPDGQRMYLRGAVYAFNPATGVLGNVLARFPALSDNNVTFTPDSRFLYGTQPVGVLSRVVVRYDLATTTETLQLIEALEPPGSTVEVSVNGAFQIGPNGFLYFLEQSFSAGRISYGLSEIRCPSSSRPTVRRNLVDLSAFADAAALGNNPPQFVDAIFRRPFLADTVRRDTAAVRLCPSDDNRLTADISGTAYRWSTGDTTATIRVPGAGVYQVTVTETCNRTVATYAVTIQPPIVAEINSRGLTDELCVGEPLELSVSTNAEAPIAQLTWEDGTTETPRTVTAALGETYRVQVVSTCGDVAEATIQPEVPEFCDCTGLFPDLITPNGDGTNDFFRLFTNCPVMDYTLVIFNRWGQAVFRSADPSVGWDGTTKGQPQNTDTYLYQAVFRLADEDEPQTRSGDFSLIR